MGVSWNSGAHRGSLASRDEREKLFSDNARIEHAEALRRVMTTVLNDDMQLFKQFTDNEGFQQWLTDTVFGMTYAPSPTRATGPGLTALLPTGVQEQPMPLSLFTMSSANSTMPRSSLPVVHPGYCVYSGLVVSGLLPQ